jgi:hypothetical protein
MAAYKKKKAIQNEKAYTFTYKDMSECLHDFGLGDFLVL